MSGGASGEEGGRFDPIDGSPLSLTVVPEDENPDPAKSRIMSASSGAYVAGQAISTLLVLKNQYNIALNSATADMVQVLPSAASAAALSASGSYSLNNQLGGVFSLSLTVTQAGSYAMQLQIRRSGAGAWASLQGSPVSCHQRERWGSLLVPKRRAHSNQRFASCKRSSRS